MPGDAQIHSIRGWLPGLALAALVLAVFGPALAGGYVDDDLDLMTTSPAFRGPGQLVAAVVSPFWGYELPYWRPLTSLVMGLGHWLGGGSPWLLHAAALLAHTVATVLVRRLLRQLGCSAPLAWLGAASFAVLPTQVEAVAWVAALGDPLAGMATLGCVSAWLRWRDRGGARAPWAAWLWFVLALAAKENGLFVLPWLAAIEIVRRQQVVPGRRRAGLGFAALVLSWYGARCLVFGDLAAGFDRGDLGLGLDAGTGALLRLYLGAAFVGLPSGWFGITPYRSIPPDAAALWRALPWPLLALAAAVSAWRVARRHHGGLAFVAAVGFAASLLPVLLAPDRAGPWPLVDRYAYLAAFAYAAVLVAAGATRPWLAAVLVLVAAVVSAAHVPAWRDQDAVVAAARRRVPRHPEVLAMAGHQALAAAERATDAAARNAAYRTAHDHFVAALRGLQRPLYAARALQRTIGPSARLGQALAAAYGRLVPAAAALAAFAPLLQERPDDTAVLLAFGAAAASLDDVRTAEQAWQRAFVVDPACDQAACNLGRLYLLAGQREAARRWLTTTLRLRPDNQLAASLLQQLR